jgi:hypothetical protein
MGNRFHPFVAAGLIACAACHRNLETRVNGRVAQTLQAEARPAQGGWEVSLPLPSGKWVASATAEGTVIRVVDQANGQEARWLVTVDRWRNSDRPFLFRLSGEGGTVFDMEVKYGQLPTTPRVLLNVIYMMVGGKIVVPA